MSGDADPSVQLARKTEWREQEADVFFGAGQRLLTTDVGDYPILDVRLVFLNSPIPTPPPSG